MGKIRVYELAKEAGVESKVLTAQLIELGYKVRAYNSTLDEETAVEIRTRLGFKKVEVKVKRIESKGRTTIIRRRKKVAPEPDFDVEEAEVEEKVQGQLETSVQENDIESAPQAADAVEAVETVETSEVEQVEVEPVSSAKEESISVAEKPESEPQEASMDELLAADVQAYSKAAEVKETVEKETPEAAEAVEEKPVSITPPQKVAAPVKRKKGLAKIIGRTELPIQVDTHKPKPKYRPKKTDRPKKPATVQRAAGAPGAAGDAAKGADADKKSKVAKKGKRFVRFSHEPQPAAGRFKKGTNRKGQVVVDADEIGKFSGRLAGGVKFGRGNRGGRKKKKRDDMFVAEASETKLSRNVSRSLKLFLLVILPTGWVSRPMRLSVS